MNLVCSKRDLELNTAAKADPAFLADVLTGLSARQKVVPARWLYDHRGSELFEAITTLPEYYPTRTERSILERHAKDIAERVGRGRVVIEFGSGSSTKTPLLLSAIEPQAYVPIDVSGEFLHESVQVLSRAFPALPVHPVVGDFTKPMQLPRLGRAPRLGFFPGSTIGNFVASEAVDLLRAMARTLGDAAQLLIGVDRIKDPQVLVPAYDDAAGVTAQFNLNLLDRINRELGGTIPVGAFRHRAIWNDDEARIEMHLLATRDMAFEVADRMFRMSTGETIHTENSIKYGTRDARVLLRAGGWTPIAEWTDAQQLFSVVLAEATIRPAGP
ncbi:L-histidine N(alpha)-methyltransferase [Frateuria hangzhouensis]|uniref:L-histidine N(alpha)-methyltransferase n=1 Tax=Frateuria hangzhouensis TaxID=2995589 RepID=UPI002260E0E4|nr:L-histidine N(alpha)-methyltransferase [Frateuria sp. STR12]MCX7513076.1 L-histidine N(alpha)-methyltransferase [Frateuria sp. STR12]